MWGDGAVRLVCVTSSLLRDARSAPMHVLAQVEDVTERRAAERALTPTPRTWS